MYQGKLKFVEENEGIFLKANLANPLCFWLFATETIVLLLWNIYYK